MGIKSNIMAFSKTESRIQQECAVLYRNTFCLAHHKPRCLIFSVPNELKPQFTQTGLLAGTSDLVVIHVCVGSVRVIFAEIKAEGKQSPAQVRFQERIRVLGETIRHAGIAGLAVEYHLVRSLGEFQRIFEATAK